MINVLYQQAHRAKEVIRMIIPMKEIVKRTADELNAPQPDFSMVPGVKINKKIIKLKLKDIFVDDKKGNTAREHGTDPEAVETLSKSLSKGWDSTEYLPAVREKSGDDGYKYELIYGFNREEALENLYGDEFEMWFTLIDCNESGLYDIRLIENEGLPKRTNKESDIKYTIIQKIDNGDLKKDVDSIKDYLDRCLFFRSQESKDRIVKMVEEAANLNVSVDQYTESKAKRWSKNYCKTNYDFGGSLVNGKHTFLCKQGSAYRTYHRMMRRYLETGNPCQVVFHVGSPTPKKTIIEKRKDTMKEWLAGIDNLKKLGCNTSFMEVAGFLPQVRGKDEYHSLIQVK